MRIFILCTGRSGSVTLANACKHMINFSSGHETRAGIFTDRLEYPDHHIEADNRLSWFLGGLDQKYGHDAFYVHLIRDRKLTTESFMRRWTSRGGIIGAFAEGVLKTPLEKINDSEKREICELYYDTINDNITFFLKDKPKKMTINLEDISSDFVKFWDAIDAQGDLNASLEELNIQHNSSANLRRSYLYNIKLKLLGMFRMVK